MKRLLLLIVLVAAPLAAQKLTDADERFTDDADRVLAEIAKLDAMIADPAKARAFFESRKALLQERLAETEFKLLRKNGKSPATDRVDWTAKEIKKVQ